MVAKHSARLRSPIAIRPRWALYGALGLVGVMVLSSLAPATLGSFAGPAQATGFGSPLGLTTHATPLTGAQLQKSPVVQAQSTPLDSTPNAQILSSVPVAQPIQFTVGFALRNPTELANIVEAQSTPGSPMYHHWLSLSQEETMFGPDPVVVQNTINYYTSLGFQVGTVGPMSIAFTGTAGGADLAFHTQLSNVAFGSGPAELMNSQPLSVPGPLAASIASINGFEGTTQFAPALLAAPSSLTGLAPSDLGGAVATSTSLDLNYTNETEAYNFTNHAFYWFEYYSQSHHKYITWQTITPAALTTMYDVQPLLDQGYNGNATGGHPITIAIVMAGGINPSDLESYGKMVFNNPNQLISRVSPVTVDRTYGLNGTQTYTDDGSGEMALDLEYSGTMAPAAKLVPVYGPCLCTNVLDDDYAKIDAMSPMPNLVSNSWGGEEDGAGSLSGPNWQNDLTMHDYFMLIDARGSTILASSGDGGGFDLNCETANGCAGSGILGGSFPATDPYVLSVDGVRTAAGNAAGQVFPNPSNLGIANISISTVNPYTNYPTYVNTANTMPYQSYWYQPFSNTTLTAAAPQAAGGFGTSYWFNQSWYQHAVGVPDVGRSLGSGVSAEADFNESIFFDGNFELFYGGTSFACPTIAGMLADVLTYLADHNGPTAAYQGNGNIPVFTLGNAWQNGNLSYDPFFNVDNGTSYWANLGVSRGWQWPPGQVFPETATGKIIYGDTNTSKGWNFPTGWGVINAYNFARDLSYLDSLQGNFITTSSIGGAANVGAWANLATNQTYAFHVNATSAMEASNPHVTVEFYPKLPTTEVATTPENLTPALSTANTPWPGYGFTVSTGSGVIDQPGLLIFVIGSAANHTMGFAYDWVSWALPTSGALEINVVDPNAANMASGSATFGAGLGFFFPPIVADPEGPNGPNLVLVRVTLAGVGVYNAVVTGTVPSPYDLAFEGSRALNASQSYGQGNTPVSPVVSTTFTNLTGYAYVYTWSVIKPTPLFINATYSTETASTTYTMVPPPNIQLNDNYGGKFSEFNWIAWILYATRQQVTTRNEKLYVANELNQSGWYSLLFGFAGEELPVTVNNYQGSAVPNAKVWFGDYDTGRITKYYDYVGTDGVIGTSNDSLSWNYTHGNGVAMIQIPQNQSMNAQSPVFGGPIGTFDGPASVGAIAVSIPGVQNVTTQIDQACPPPGSSSSNVLLTCVFNDSIQRNYTATPILVLPDPVNAWTQTPASVHRDFFGQGAPVSFGVDVNLATNNPWVSGDGYNWAPGPNHVVSVDAYIDGTYAGNANPAPNNNYQDYEAHANLTGTYRPGIHELEVVVTVSTGQIFTYTHRFIVGNINLLNFSIQNNTYTPIPFDLQWNFTVPRQFISNYTFNQSIEVQYVTGGCSGATNPCPIVVNLSRKIIDGQNTYNQSINQTMLDLNGFYGGAGALPAGQYLITVWLNANHSGSVTAQVPTYLVFNDINATFDGPSSNQQVPVGNVTISYTYTGGYVSNASLSVFAENEYAAPVYTTGIFVPSIGSQPRGGAATWDATITGPYLLIIDLGTPYIHQNYTEWINVTSFANQVYLNTTGPSKGFMGIASADIGTVLALAAGLLGFLVGLFAAPAFRGAPGGPESGSGAPKPKAWEEISKSGAGGVAECPVCHEHFETEYAMHNHQKMAHGIEE